jgi:phage tail protein X
MKRYTNIPVVSRYDGKRVYLTTTYPIIKESDSDIVIISNETDYLDALANKYYGDTTLWWIIALANNIGKGRLSVPSGITLRIPLNVSSIVNEFNRLNAR